METERPCESKRPGEGDDSQYAAFDQLDGQHPWRDAMPEGFIDYPARICADIAG